MSRASRQLDILVNFTIPKSFTKNTVPLIGLMVQPIIVIISVITDLAHPATV